MRLTTRSENQFERSSTLHFNGSRGFTSIRTSSTAHLLDHDPIVDCIYKRVSEFQGYHPEKDMEPFQVTRYEKGQQYEAHHDYFGPNQISLMDNTNRITTFFGILEADCEECGTRFMRIAMDWKEER